MSENNSAEWTSEDASAALAFFKSPSGQRLLKKISESRPFYSAGFETNQRLIQGAQIEGFENCVAAILGSMTASGEPHPELQASQYPDLEDDAAWAGIGTAQD